MTTKTNVKERAPETPLLDVPPPKKNEVATAPASPLVQANPDNLIAALIEGTSNPNVDGQKARVMWDLYKEVQAEQARLAFLADFHKLKPHLPVIDQKGMIVIEPKPGSRNRNPQRTPFAKWIDIQEGATDLLNSYNFILSHSTEPSPDGSRIHIVTTLHHIKGHSWRTTFPLPAEVSGSKNNVQGWGASNSYGKRYNTVNILDLKSRAPEDADKDAASEGQIVDGKLMAEKITAEQMADLKVKVTNSVGLKRFCDKYNIKALEELPAKLYDEATTACENFIAEKTKRQTKE